MEILGISVGVILGAIYILYFFYVLCREFGLIPKLFPIALMRYPYVVIHEVSHLFMGLLMGKGVRKLILKKTDGSGGWFSEGTGAPSAGYYQPARGSWVGIGFIRLGDALTSLAGPALSLLYVMGLVRFISEGNIHSVVTSLGIVYLVCIIFSRQRLRFLLFALFTSGLFWYGRVGHTHAVMYLVVFLLAWIGVGLIEEIIIIGGYNRHGSDMGNFTRALIGVDWQWLSYLLNKVMQAYYLYGLYFLINRLL